MNWPQRCGGPPRRTHEEQTDVEDPNWPDGYALYMVRERDGEELPS
jgi:hypothetical protein